MPKEGFHFSLAVAIKGAQLAHEPIPEATPSGATVPDETRDHHLG
jgi:hypothetical protein